MRTDNFSLNYLYQLPMFASHWLGWHNAAARAAMDGWQFAHHFTIFGGLPISPGFSVQEANTGTSITIPTVFMGSPDITPRLGISGNLSSPNSAEYFNPNALSVPQLYPAGNGTGPRNYITQPGTFSNDMTMSKKVYDPRGQDARASGQRVQCVQSGASGNAVGHQFNGAV